MDDFHIVIPVDLCMRAELYLLAKSFALEEGRSVDDLVERFLEAYVSARLDGVVVTEAGSRELQRCEPKDLNDG